MNEKIRKKYQQDILKSRKTPLLIELSKEDLNALGDKSSLDISFRLAKELYGTSLKDANKTNIIFIDSDKVKDSQSIFLLEELVNILQKKIKSIQNIKVIKESICSLVSFSSAGMLNDITDTIIDDGIDLLLDKVVGDTQDFFVNKTLNQIDVKVIDKIRNSKLYLSNKAKETINELIQQLKNEMTPAESFRFIIQLLLSTTVEMPKLLYIKNPHKLDKNSLAILSLLLSISKDKGKHAGLSIVYCYEDENFQPYMKVDKKHTVNKQLLDEQRHFAQRYAMLERPTSDIPNIAVKSWMFVGREEELKSLNARYFYSKENKDIATLEIVSAEPGIGKTKLVKEHLGQIRKEKDDKKQIQLQLLNQVGHTSTNTGLSSLIDSIVNEVKRLEELQKFTEPKDYVYKFVLDTITTILGIDAVVNISQVASDRIFSDGQIGRVKLNSAGNIDDKSQDKKEEQFRKLTEAIKKLQQLSDESMPIVLFVDDLQWIDEDSSQYIIDYFTQQFNVHIVSTIRPGDATTSLKKAHDDKELNPYKISLLKKAHIKLYDDNENEIEITSMKNTNDIKIESDKIHLLGLNTETLKSLISQVIQVVKVIKDSEKYSKILARSIIKKFEDSKAKGTANTLFAIETINMLCDKKLYASQNNQGIEKLILTDSPIQFNTKIIDFQEALKNTFKILDDKYRVAFEHINAEQKDKEFKQKFNLTAYAVLEERLNILKIYFAKHGNEAVNTLLFSSLLGTPFNSNIVKNVLNSVATTDEELLQPLREYILDGKDKVSLTETHYEIIEEVYEILSRYTAFDNSYEYRHSLLNIFLDKQLEYQLDSIFEKDNTDAKEKLYILIIGEISNEEKQQKFYKKNNDNLTTEEFNNKLFYKMSTLNILKKGCEHNIKSLIKAYIRASIKLSNFLFENNQLEKADDILEPAILLIKNDLTYWMKDYVSILISKSAIYSRQATYSNQKIYVAIEKLEEALPKIKDKSYKDKYGEETYNHDYITCLTNLSNYYYIVDGFYNRDIFTAIDYAENALKKVQNYYGKSKEFRDEWFDKYITLLNNLAAAYYKTNTKSYIPTAIELQKQALLIIEENMSKEGMQTSRIRSTGSLAAYLYDDNKVEEAIEYQEENIKNIEKLFDDNKNLWREQYAVNLLNFATSLENNNRIGEAYKYHEKVVEITRKFYNIEPYIFTEYYIRSLNQINIVNYKKICKLYKIGLLDKESMQKKQLDVFEKIYNIYKISESIFGENNSNTIIYKDSYLHIKDEMKNIATFKEMLYIAKSIALLSGKKEINSDCFFSALSFIKLNDNAKYIFSQHLDIDQLTEEFGSRCRIEDVINQPIINFNIELKSLIDELKHYFQEEPIGYLQ